MLKYSVQSTDSGVSCVSLGFCTTIIITVIIIDILCVPFIGNGVGVDTRCSWRVTSAALWKTPGCQQLTSIATKSSSEKREASGAVSHQRGRMVAASLSFPLLLLLHLASPAPAADAKEVAQVHNPALGEVVQVGRAYPLHNVVSQSSQVVPPPTGDGGKGETKRAALLLDKIMFAVQKVIMTIFIITTRA